MAEELVKRPAELVKRPMRGALIAAGVGAIALIPPAIVVIGGVLGLGVPRMLNNPVVVLGGLAFALLVNIGASMRWRAHADRDGVRMELDLRFRYRGINRAVLITAAVLAAAIIVYLIGENFGPR
jgi:hypothetical protein